MESTRFMRMGYLDYTPLQMNFVTETMTALLIDRAVGAGDVVVDVGASRGFHTRTLLKAVGPSGHVHAVEANPRLARRLRRLSRSNLRVHACAACDLEGRARFHIPVDVDEWASLMTTAHDPKWRVKKVGVDLARVDALCCEGDRPSFVKIDVEGGEFAALRGMVRILEDARPVVCFESPFTDVPACFLRENGYFVFDLFGGSHVPKEPRLANLLAVPADVAERWADWSVGETLDELDRRFTERWPD